MEQNNVARGALIVSAVALVFLIATAMIAGFAYLETKKQRAAAEDQVRVQIDTENRQLRAYITLFEAKIVIQGASIFTTSQFKNNGQTPAYDVRKLAFIELAPADKPFIPSAQTASANALALAQGIVGPGTAIMTRPSFERVDTIQDVISGKTLIHAYGEVQYRDAFDRYWCLSFKLTGLQTKDSGWQLGADPDGNEEKNDHCWQSK